MKNSDFFDSSSSAPPKTVMNSLYFEDPLNKKIERSLNQVSLEYFYFKEDFNLKVPEEQVLCGCLLSGNSHLEYKEQKNNLEQFDFFFLPEGGQATITNRSQEKSKICMLYSPILNRISKKFIIDPYQKADFIDRGESGSNTKMATFRRVWTAIKNGYFMAGITSLPRESLNQGVVTSVNIEESEEGGFRIYPHIHPDYPEVYIFAIDDKNYAITQYLINQKGETVCKDLTDGGGFFFPGELGHMNFGRPFYKKLKYCYYIWIIPTFGLRESVEPITLPV